MKDKNGCTAENIFFIEQVYEFAEKVNANLLKSMVKEVGDETEK